MVKIYLSATMLFGSSFLFSQKPICGNEIMNKNDNSLNRNIEFERTIARYLSQNHLNTRSEIIIPVVVHVVWNTAIEKISDEVIFSQIDALNRDYNLRNKDAENVPTEFRDLIGNVGIRFCLASVDPQGYSTTGILKIKTDKTEIGISENVFFTSKGGSDAWDTQKYLNIWVANTGKLISGLGTYPDQSTPEKTGVIIHPKYFGINGNATYGLGRVATHEVGHYFGLLHLWADDLDCNTDDDVLDTPPQKKAYLGCPSFPKAGCSESEMFMNFMDYVDDPCMIMFTKGQKDRILATLNTYRKGLLSSQMSCFKSTSSVNNQIQIYPNPSNGLFQGEFLFPPSKLVDYSLYNILGQLIERKTQFIDSKFYIDISNYQAGLYLLKIEGEIYKLIKK